MGHRHLLERKFRRAGERTDHKHLGQIITYASGIDAKILIWLCREVTEEHRKAIDWLNEVTNADISFFACEIELWRIGNSLPAPRCHIIASPNDWSKSMKASNTSNGLLTETKKGHLAFWNGLKTYMEEHGTDLRLRSPRPQHWYTLAVGRSKFSISLTTNTQLKRVGCEIYIRGQNAKNAFHQLKSTANKLKLLWDMNLTGKSCPTDKTQE